MSEDVGLRSQRDVVNKQFEEEFSATLRAIEYRNRLTRGILFVLCLCGLLLVLKFVFLRGHASTKKNWRDKFNNMFAVVALHRLEHSGLSGCLAVQQLQEGRLLWLSRTQRDESVVESFSLSQSNVSSKASARLPAAHVVACQLLEEPRNESVLLVLDDKAKQLASFRLAGTDSLGWESSTAIRGLNSPVGVSRSGSGSGHLYLSDGRDRLYFVELSSGRVEDSYLQISEKSGEPADIGIGALQQAGDFVVAVNTKTPNELLLLDTTTSRLVGRVDLSQLFDHMNELLKRDRLAAIQTDRPVSAVAFDAQQRTLFVTGQDWPLLFELKFPERTFTRKPASKPSKSSGE